MADERETGGRNRYIVETLFWTLFACFQVAAAVWFAVKGDAGNAAFFAGVGIISVFQVGNMHLIRLTHVLAETLEARK